MKQKYGKQHTSNGQVSEEEPARDEGLFGGAGSLAHDVQIRGVESQSGGWQTVSHQVHPQKLNWDQSLRKTKSSSQEDTEEDGENKSGLESAYSRFQRVNV